MARANLILIISLLGLSAASMAQGDFHLADSPAKSFFHQSSWAHGYMHGYESGFHEGNLDLHMARSVRDPHKVAEYKKSSHCFRAEFGNRNEFEKGYGSGFEVGYLDGATGRDFRAASEVSRLSPRLEGMQKLTAKQSAHMDIVLDAGYSQGRRTGLDDARSKSQFKEAEEPCPELAQTEHFCSAYQVGYRWGYSDGYSNQRPDTGTQRASK
jgi:hypothetical protein